MTAPESSTTPASLHAGADQAGASSTDVLVIGRLGVDLYPLQDGVGLEEVSTFGKYLGGSAANVAAAVSRLGDSVALASRVGDDPFGRFLHQELDRLGVGRRFVGVDPHLKTPVTFCEIFPPDSFPLYFYRDPKAPDLNIGADDIDDAVIRDAGILWLTATGFCQEPSRSTQHAALEIRGGRAHTVLDLDFRPAFWSDPQQATSEISTALQYVTVAVGNAEECAVAVGERDPFRAADALLERGVDLAIVKRGPEGVLARTRTETIVVPPHPVKVVNGLGAGDAFGGALCHGLLHGWGLAETMRFANVAGAIVAGRRECASAMPSAAQIEAELEAAA